MYSLQGVETASCKACIYRCRNSATRASVMYSRPLRSQKTSSPGSQGLKVMLKAGSNVPSMLITCWKLGTLQMRTA